MYVCKWIYSAQDIHDYIVIGMCIYSAQDIHGYIIIGMCIYSAQDIHGYIIIVISSGSYLRQRY